MSRKHRHPRKPAGLSNLANALLPRRFSMDIVRDRIMLQMRIFRNMIADREANEEMWSEVAALINVFGAYAHERRMRQPFLDLVAGADVMRAIEARHNRVGGRWAATDTEIGPLTVALETIDNELMPTMAMVDFVRLAEANNAAK